MKFAKERAIPFIKQKLGGVKHRVKDFLQDRWNRLKERLGIKNTGKTGKEAAEGGAKQTDNAARKAAELPAAIAQAKAITEINDVANTPIPALIGALNAAVKSKYPWIKRFEARPKGKLGHYSIHMIASEHEIDGDYSDDNHKTELPEGQERTPEELSKARNYFKNNKQKAREMWEQRTGQEWPVDESGRPVRASHPRPLADGGHPLHVEPGINSNPNTEHIIPDPLTGKTDQQRYGGRRRKNKS